MIREEFKKRTDENKEQYIYRLAQEYIETGKMDWKQMANIINEGLGLDEDEWLSESAIRKPYQYSMKYYQNVFAKKNSDEFIRELEEAKREVEKEKIKVRTEKVEYNRWLREDARDQLIMEQIISAIEALPPLDIPSVRNVAQVSTGREYILAFGDEHFGVEFELKGFYGETINSYSPEIFYQRMGKLLDDVVDIVDKENIETLKVFSMGDFTDGCLRVSQLMKLRYGVIEGTIKYADFISRWLTALSNYVNVEFYQVGNANHEELRMLGQPKGTFTEDNMGKVVGEFIKVRLADNPNFKYIENPTKYIYTNVCGFTIVGTHGDGKALEKLVSDLEKIYGISINYLFAGHLHHSKIEEIGKCKEVIYIPSIIGADSFSLSLGKVSSSSAKLLVFEDKKGKVIEYTIKLD